MTINKRKLLRVLPWLVGVVLILTLSVLLYRWYLVAFAPADAFAGVPKSSALIIDVHAPNEIIEQLKQKPYATDVLSLSFINGVARKWKNTKELIQQFSHPLPERVTIAAQINSKNQMDYVFILSNFDQKVQLAQAIEQLSVSTKTLSFDKKNFYRLQLSDSSSIHAAQVEQMLIVAESPVLVQSVLRQFRASSTNILKAKSLQAVRKLTGKTTNVSLYFNMEYLPLFSSFYTQVAAQRNLKFIQFFAEWIGVDVDFQDKQISLNGYLAPSKQNKILRTLKQQELPDKTLIANVLPDNTAAMTYIGYKSASDFFQMLNREDNAGFEEYFVPWLGEEVAYVVTEPRSMPLKSHQLAIFRMNDRALAQQSLEEYGKKFGELEGEQYFNYRIQRIMANNLLKPIFGEGLNPINHPYYVVLDDYIVFANDDKALKELLDKYTYGQTLGQDINYLQFIETLSSTSNMYFYVNTANVLNILTEIFDEKWTPLLEQEFKHYQKLTPIGMQLTPYQDLYFINTKIKYNKKGKQATSVLWKADLKANAAIPPTFVKNHQTNDLEIFVQDEANIIYLFDKNGEELWHRAIDGKIISEVHQVDFYKNTYLQYLFNTKNKIYLIDRNGLDVEGFPIELEVEITNGITVTDYDTTRDYRYFVAGNDGNVYGFRGAGEWLDGWNPKKNIGTVAFPLQHFSNDGKDYLVILNEAGTMYFFQRDGSVRMDSIPLNTAFRSPLGYDLTEPKRIVAANEEGKAFVINFEQEYFPLGMEVAPQTNLLFEYADVLADERKDYILLGAREIGIFSYDEAGEFKRFAKRKLDTKQDALFEVQLVRSSKKSIGTLSKTARKAYLLDGKGQLFPNFPIPATTPFSIADLFKDGKNTLIVADGSAVYAYKLRQVGD